MEQYDDVFYRGKLIAGYLKDDLEPKEKTDLEEWLNASPENRDLFNRLTAESKLEKDFEAYGATDKSAAWQKIASETGYLPIQKQRHRIGISVAAAAIIVLCLSIGVYFINLKSGSQQLAGQNSNNLIVPGSSKAILTLANGRKIILGDAKNGILINQEDMQVNKKASGQLVYDQKKNGNNSEIGYDTLTTPRGGIYSLVLADGSKIWLNASTSIRYPEKFGKSREIELITGEAYFEVVHNTASPFRVTTANGIIEDVGTHFNINAYTDEPAIRTTLLEGSVKMIKGKNSALLKPGEEASLAAHTDQFKIAEANLEKAIAWKNGNFVFTGDNIAPIMRQISRWYDVEVVYQGTTAHKDFVGSVSRFKNVSQVLNTLELTGTVHFKIEGRRITVISE